MPLLLAIEPDSRHAELIEQQARRLGAELVMTTSADAAIGTLRQRVPDLVLTSLLLSPRDEAKLQDQLRQLDGAGAHVQTLVIPVMSEPAEESAKPTGMLSRLRKRRPAASGQEGCDPAVFGAQIAQYLERAARMRTQSATTRPLAPAEQPAASPQRNPGPVPEAAPVTSAPAERLADSCEPLFVGDSPQSEPMLQEPPAGAGDPPVDEPHAVDLRVNEAPAVELPVHEASSVDLLAEVDIFLMSDRAWQPRRPLVVEENEYDGPTLAALLDPGARGVSHSDTPVLLAALRQSMDQMRAAHGQARSVQETAQR